MITASQAGFAALVLDLTGRDDGFHLAADINQDLVTIDEDHSTLNQLASAELGVLRLFVFFEQRAHILGGAAYLRASLRRCVLCPGWCCSCLLLGAFRRLF